MSNLKSELELLKKELGIYDESFEEMILREMNEVEDKLFLEAVSRVIQNDATLTINAD